MKKQKTYIMLTLVISFLFGIILPLALGVKDFTLIAICFSSVWFVYAVLLNVTTFLIKRGLRIKVSRQNGATVVRYDLRDRGGVNLPHNFITHTQGDFDLSMNISS